MHKDIADWSDNSPGDNRTSKNPHLADGQLLLALDGELSPSEAALVEVHLESCWSCRRRSEQIGEAIADFVEYRHGLIKCYSSPSAGTRAMFVAQLEQLA